MISPLSTFASILNTLPDELQRYIATPGTGEVIGASQHLAILVGPEGGMTEREETRSKDLGFIAIRIGTRVLRTETASVARI